MVRIIAQNVKRRIQPNQSAHWQQNQFITKTHTHMTTVSQIIIAWQVATKASIEGR